MLETDVNGMPVVDAAGIPVGMVSDGDLVGRRADRRDWWLEMLATRSPPGAGFPLPDLDRAVHEVMTSPVITIAHTASIKDIAEALQAHRVKRLPVLEKGRLVGSSAAPTCFASPRACRDQACRKKAAARVFSTSSN